MTLAEEMFMELRATEKKALDARFAAMEAQQNHIKTSAYVKLKEAEEWDRQAEMLRGIFSVEIRRTFRNYRTASEKLTQAPLSDGMAAQVVGEFMDSFQRLAS